MKRMRVFCCLFLVIVLIACSNDKEKAKNVTVDKKDDEVEVTFPEVLFKKISIDLISKKAKSAGIDEVVRNDDGSVTYKMSKSVYNDMLEQTEQSINNIVNNSKEKTETFKDITHNKNCSKFTLVVDRKKYENSFGGFTTYIIGIAALNYQIYRGASTDDAKVSISLKDEKTGEVFSEITFPDVLEELDKDKNEK